MNPPIVIATCSTIPSRVNKMKETLLSIKNQSFPIHHIEVNLPTHCKRTNEPYPEPLWLNDLSDCVQIHTTPDMGPITKIYPTIERHQSEDIFIFSFDDDINYPPQTLQTLIESYKSLTKPTQLQKRKITDVAVGISGFNFTTLFNKINIAAQYSQEPVHVVEGYAGVLYHTTCFKPDFKVYISLTQKSQDAFFSDDVIISNYLERQKIPRHVAISESYNRLQFWENKDQTVLNYGLQSDALQAQTGGHNQRYERLFRDPLTKNLMKIKPTIIL